MYEVNKGFVCDEFLPGFEGPIETFKVVKKDDEWLPEDTWTDEEAFAIEVGNDIINYICINKCPIDRCSCDCSDVEVRECVRACLKDVIRADKLVTKVGEEL